MQFHIYLLLNFSAVMSSVAVSHLLSAVMSSIALTALVKSFVLVSWVHRKRRNAIQVS